MKRKTNYLVVIVITLLAIMGLAFFTLDKEEKVIDEPVIIDVEDDKEEKDYQELIEAYEYGVSLNDDYVGEIFFESGLIRLPFVQGNDNGYYMNIDWETGKYEIGGTVFMDFRNDFENDQNIILYGHNYEKSYDSSLSKKFTPLRFLTEKDKYEANKYIDLFVGDRLLRYEISNIFRVAIVEDEEGNQYIDDEEPVYIERFYDDYFDEYINKVNERSYYDTGVKVNSDDKLLTLQTCIDGTIDKLVVLARQVETIEIKR